MNLNPRASLAFLIALVFAAMLPAAPRDKEWKQVDEAAAQGLPKTAIERLDPIISAALAEKAYAEAIKAIGRKIALEGEIQGGKAEEKIARLEAELAKAPEPMKPMMQGVLAHWYWQYFQQNRWRIQQRTATAEAPGADLQTWDLARILAEIDRHFTAALTSDKLLQATPISEYDDLLQPGTAPDTYRPTLFDFLAYEALQFYQSGEQAARISENEFEIDATSPILGTTAEFLAWQLPPADGFSPKHKAISIYQSLLRFHAKDKDRSAFLDADLARLSYASNIATGETKTDRYKAALERFIEETNRHEISSRAIAALATQLNADDEPAKARDLAQRGLDAFPKSAGAAQCFNLIQEIEAPSAQLKTESVWNAPWPTLDVTYRNVTQVYFRAIPIDFNDHVTKSRWNYGRRDTDYVQLLATPPALQWSAELPATTDFKERTESLSAPATLRPGFYAIVASYDPTFHSTDNQISIATAWVSDLALVLRLRHDRTEHSGLVLNALTGEPVSGATIRLWKRNNDGAMKPVSPKTTDANGQFTFSTENNPLVILAEHAGHAVASGQEVYAYGYHDRVRAQTQTVFFTDRAIYRPGQTVSYKGVSIRYDQNAAKYDAVARRKVTVLFKDPNGQEIARATHTTNDYGSFSGVFTAPRDRLAGRMSIQVSDGNGSTGFSVEEYKRPKFQVALDAPAEAAKLDAPVTVTGKATAYTGASIGGAKVKWRVERLVQLPYWCWWFQPPATKSIAHGTAITDADGTFKIDFTAAPDRAVPEKNEPVFVFNIHADITDTTGETRSSNRSVRSGYTALQATLTADDWQTSDKPVELAIATTSLDSDPQSATGTLTLHALKQPEKVQRASLQQERSWWRFGNDTPPVDPTNPDSWELGERVASEAFSTDAKSAGLAKIPVTLKPGIYRASVETKDRFGKTVTARHTVQVLDPAAARFSIKIPDHLGSPTWSVEPGENFTALWGTGYDQGRAFVELECAGKPIKSYWTPADRTQSLIELPVAEAMRGGFTLCVTSIRENRAYTHERVINVPWSNKQLTVKWDRFRSKLLPGEKETWTATISGPDASRASAEMVAALYDVSLDQYQPHNWPQTFGVFRTEFSRTRIEFQNELRNFNTIYGWKHPENRSFAWSYRSFPHTILQSAMDGDVIELHAFSVSSDRRGGALRKQNRAMAPAPAAMLAESKEVASESYTVLGQSGGGLVTPESPPPPPNLSKITVRTNLNETAFFFPQLLSGDDGVVKMVFTMPEALTEWKLLGFAHDKQLRSGFITEKVVTAKDLMVEPNPPRFLREGDTLEFTVKVTNQSDQPQTGTVRLTFTDAATQASVDAALANQKPEQLFDVPAKQSRSYSWRISVPDGLGFLTYKAVAASTTLSDGEDGFLPVLSRRILVTESLPLPIRGKSTKQFTFPKLLNSGSSDTLKHQSLTVQMTSQPAWYAVMALPYLMEYPYECSEQVFNRLYANALARHIAASDPKIRRVFDLWKNTPALDSPLEKNQNLKSVLLEETPWLRQAKSESEARRNVGLLFDANRLDEESARQLRTLSERQLSEGLWPWFPGGRPSEYISLYITTGFGRLRHLGVELDTAPAIKSLAGLDAWMTKRHADILKSPHPDQYVPGYTDALYLYGRSFFLKDRPIAAAHKAATDFFLQQSRKFWLRVDSRQSQAHLALALQRFDDKATALAIVKSLRERSVSNEELGMFWRDTELSWWWYRAPIETQALMIEAFSEIADDKQAVEDLQVWLLKQKQTQNWKTTKATADAIYGLLVRGNNLLSSDALVEVSLGGETIKPEKVEAGTGFYEKTFAASEIKPTQGEITVRKTDDGVSWGSVHWQYLEDIAKITPHEGTPLTLKKTLWLKENTSKGPVLKPVSGALAVGDELVVRIELRTDRDMEFVHLKDQRGSGTEPVNVLSRYRYQDGLGYYESTRDTASHFFIDYLPKGTYVFEYSTRVQLRGRYQSGIAEIQCMYAPEFNSHSESIALEIK
ncbi:hypothetical protein CMV30_15565 [Nibricoccus aquaticus]|uniref:Alpha-2-macroglobulin domain-containing protein n=1 Tax=Nibricoccus aquaticus TaxID=2576891 RepID=A0A290QG50_9BACT|nr:alpha-2-macroglobulin family protein [Nibricoccus aquaticus]ATC65256.1 hypothetical protein CMV30_15565 [Nibricoccus aquaticus]